MFKKITVYVVRIGATGEPRDSAPCEDCSAKMKELGVKKVVYTNSEGNLVSEKMKDYKTNHVTLARRLTKSK